MFGKKYSLPELQQLIVAGEAKKLAKGLRKFENPDMRYGSGINLLHYYVTVARKSPADPAEICNVLVRAGVEISGKNDKGATPLHFAAEHGLPSVTQALIAAGAKVNEQDTAGNTPLFKLVKSFDGTESELKTIYILLEAGADKNLNNGAGVSPRDLVLRKHANLAGTDSPRDLQPHLNW